MQNRRQLLKWAGAGAAAAAFAGCASTGGRSQPRVVVIGGGFGGATAARYLRLWGGGKVAVDLVEPHAQFVSCPLSNLVLGGSREIGDLSMGYERLSASGVRVIRDSAVAIDVERRQVRLQSGTRLDYDRVIVAPGIDFMYEKLPGLASAEAQALIPHAWKAGPQTLALRAQLHAMPDGGLFAMHIPKAPYRCPPGPYERACQVALYLKAHKPRSKLVVLDANPDITSKKGLFTKAWAENYGGLIEYRPNSELTDVDARTRTAKMIFDDLRADVLNVIPPQRAGAIAKPFITANDRWCETDWLTCESKVAPGVHILGDATFSAPQMPKSGHMANQHGHLCANAVLALLAGEAPDAAPMVTNTCYSYVSRTQVVHVASVHRYEAQQKTFIPVPGSGGVSANLNQPELPHADAWARNIWSDALG